MNKLHTPGPWLDWLIVPQHSADAELVIVDGNSDNGDVIAIVDPDGIRSELDGDGVAEANARLIAAAPDLLGALRTLLLAPDLNEDATDALSWEFMARARDAIAKATGESP